MNEEPLRQLFHTGQIDRISATVSESYYQDGPVVPVWQVAEAAGNLIKFAEKIAVFPIGDVKIDGDIKSNC